MNKRAFFFLPPREISRDNYAHNPLVLAQGLKEMGWEIFSNINYWKDNPTQEKPLFVLSKDISPADCDINILTYDWHTSISKLPFEFEENNSSIKVYLEDDYHLLPPGLFPSHRQCDYILKSHYNSRSRMPSNYKPWAFGLCKRILRYTDDIPIFSQRKNEMIFGFGVSHDGEHELRSFFERRCNPLIHKGIAINTTKNTRFQPPNKSLDRFYWAQTAGRHYPDYYKRLLSTMLCCSIGGRLMPAYPASWHVWAAKNSWPKQLALMLYRFKSSLLAKPPRWNQWESWRWWECLSAGCVPIMLDFDYYGAKLPVQPVNWKHYIGIRLDRINSDIEKILYEPNIIENISIEGRAWAREHYSPLATARRFLDIVSTTRSI